VRDPYSCRLSNCHRADPYHLGAGSANLTSGETPGCFDFRSNSKDLVSKAEPLEDVITGERMGVTGRVCYRLRESRSDWGWWRRTRAGGFYASRRMVGGVRGDEWRCECFGWGCRDNVRGVLRWGEVKWDRRMFAWLWWIGVTVECKLVRWWICYVVEYKARWTKRSRHGVVRCCKLESLPVYDREICGFNRLSLKTSCDDRAGSLGFVASWNGETEKYWSLDAWEGRNCCIKLIYPWYRCHR